MENTDVQHPWEQEDDDAELEEGLVARRKNLNQTINGNGGDYSTNNVASVGGEDYNNNQQQHDEEEEEVKDFTQQNDIKLDEEEEEVKDFIQQNDTKVDEDAKESEFCVYYDKDEGIANSHVSANSDITNNNQENGNDTHSVISKQNGEHQKHEMSFEGDKSAPSHINSKTETTETKITENGDDEITEYDVETVIKKQDTHDLFCPNCNSCITKRVILRKRKRRIPVPGEDAKRSKPQTPVSSEVNVVLDDSSDNQARLDDHQREPDVFRCLSCFSIFMSTGNGFKLFRMFGNKSSEEDNEHSQNEVPVKKSWFSKFLRSEKVDHNDTYLNDSGTVNAENNVGEINSVSSNLNSSMQEANSHTSNSTTDLQKNQLQSDKVIRESNGKMGTDSTLADTQEQLLTSYHIEKDFNSESEYPGMFVVKPLLTNNVEPADNSISPLHHDGLKLLVPPNVGSLIIDNSQMNQELDITVQTNNPDSKLGQLNSGGQMNSLGLPMNVGVNEKEQKMDKDSVSIQNNVEIHLEEPLKVNKDVLTDKHINPLANAKNMEKIEGRDTIITIESKQREASVSDTLEATTLQQTVEQARITTATGGGRSLDIIKSIVYGGLIELITSLSVVSSAAGADAATLNVLALGLANIFGGLFVISHDLWNLKTERTRKTEDRYQQLLGQRAEFPLHVAVSLISYLVFGFLPPTVYGFSFYESNDKDLKLLMVAAASVVCIMILAAGKAYVQSAQKSYFKTIGYYVVFGFMVSGASFLFGGLIIKLLEKIDIFHEGSVENLIVHGASSKPALATF